MFELLHLELGDLQKIYKLCRFSTAFKQKKSLLKKTQYSRRKLNLSFFFPQNVPILSTVKKITLYILCGQGFGAQVVGANFGQTLLYLQHNHITSRGNRVHRFHGRRQHLSGMPLTIGKFGSK